MLEQRFENKKIIARTLMDGLFGVEPMKRESYDALVGLIDSYERNLLQLRKIGLETDGWSHLLAHMLYSRLDADTQRHWERAHSSREAPKYEDMLKFLRDHLATLQPLASSKPRGSDSRHDHGRTAVKSKPSSTLTTTTTTKKPCPHCQKSPHSPFKCESFNNMTPSQRLESVKKAGLCLNCLSFSHLARACPSSACRVCGQKHHTMLHLRTTSSISNQAHDPPQSQPTKPNNPQGQPLVANSNNSSALQSKPFSTSPDAGPSSSKPVALPASASAGSTVVLLSTAVVKIADYNGNVQFARVLLDCCSERNLLSERLAQKLDLRRQNDSLSLQGVGPTAATSKQSAMAIISSRCTDFAVDLKFHILPEFKPIVPSNRMSIDSWNIPPFVQFADPRFFEPNRIDAIIGAEIYYRLLLDGFIDLGPERPHLKETVFGWIVSGKFYTENSFRSATILACSNADLEKQISRFWEIESCHSGETLSVEERKCETHFAATTTRDLTGRLVVSLPKKPEVLEKRHPSISRS